jgi:hypothetical protein
MIFTLGATGAVAQKPNPPTSRPVPRSLPAPPPPPSSNTASSPPARASIAPPPSKNRYVPDEKAPHKLREENAGNSPTTTNPLESTILRHPENKPNREVPYRPDYEPTDVTTSIIISPIEPISPDRNPSTEAVPKTLSREAIVAMAKELEPDQNKKPPPDTLTQKSEQEDYSPEGLVQMAKDLTPSTSNVAEVRELSKARARRDLENLSEGIDLMIGRTKRAITEMEEDGTTDTAFAKYEETFTEEAPNMVNQVRKSITESFKYVVDPNPADQSKTQIGIIKDFNGSLQKVDGAFKSYQRASDNEEILPMMRKQFGVLITGKNAVDTMLQFYKTDFKATQTPTSQSPK